ncbi:type II secretion system F family protein [bacterium]|nr:type II secretion system F family protein [bacterium]
MPIYLFKARDRRGTAISGQLEAESAVLARRMLSQQDLIPIQVREKTALVELLSSPSRIFARIFPVPFEEVLTFNQQLQTAYTVGIPLVQAIEMIASQTKNPRIKRALLAVTEDVRNGKFLADALQKHPDVFDHIYVTLVRAGEASGELDAFLERISNLLERRAENKMKLKSALFYPKIVLGFLLVVALVFVYVLLPKIKGFFDSNRAELPVLTRALIQISDFCVGYAPLIVILALSTLMAFRYLISTPAGRLKWDAFKLRVPIMGQILLQIELNSICFITEVLLRSGVTIIETLRILRTSLDNQVIALQMDSCRVEVERGGRFSQGLARSRIFPDFFVNLMTMGEEAGKLDGVLGQVGGHYRREIDYKLTNLSKLLEPMILLVIFTVAGFLALAIFLPIWKMSRVVR